METNYLVLAIALGGTAATAQAQMLSREVTGFDVSATVDVRWEENAGMQPKSQDQVNEVQTIATLAADGRIEGAWAEFTTDYRLEDRRYSEFSRNDQTILLGESELTLGPQHRLYYAQISHSSRETSLDPLVEDIPSNRDNRVIASGTLFGSVQPGQGNDLSLWLEAADIQFDQSFEKESVRYTIGSNFERAISPIYATGVTLSYYDLQYRYLEQQDLVYSRVAALWRAGLRRWEYGAELGLNRMETDSKATTSPAAKLNVSYRSGGQILSANYSQFLSDTSQGSTLGTQFDSIGGVDGRLDGQTDQFKSRQALVTWRHVQPCRGCSIGLLLGFEDEDYLNFKELSSREVRLGGDISYRLSPNMTLSLRATLTDFEQKQNPLGQGYQQSEWTLSLSFPNLIRDGNLNIYAGTLERDFDFREGYSSDFAGARFSYSLYER